MEISYFNQNGPPHTFVISAAMMQKAAESRKVLFVAMEQLHHLEKGRASSVQCLMRRAKFENEVISFVTGTRLKQQQLKNVLLKQEKASVFTYYLKICSGNLAYFA